MCKLEFITFTDSLYLYLEVFDPVLLAYMGAREEIE